MEQEQTKAPPMKGMEGTARPQTIPERFIAIRTHHKLPPNPYRKDNDASHHHHTTVDAAAPTIGGEGTNTREKGSATSSGTAQSIAGDNPHIPSGPQGHWKKRVYEVSSSREELGEEARKKRATVWREGQPGEGAEVHRGACQGGRNPPEMGRGSEQMHVWGWHQEGDDGGRRYEDAGPSDQHIHAARRRLMAGGGQQDAWRQKYEDRYRTTTLERKTLPGPSDGTAMGELVKRMDVHRRIVAAREENAAWECYDEAKAGQPHLQGPPQSGELRDEEFLVAAGGWFLCEVCLVEVAPPERSFHVGITRHIMRVQCMKEELAWFEDA